MSLHESPPAAGSGIYELHGVNSMETLTEVRDKLEENSISIIDAEHDLVTNQWKIETQPALQKERRRVLSSEIGYLLVRPRFAA